MRKLALLALLPSLALAQGQASSSSNGSGAVIFSDPAHKSIVANRSVGKPAQSTTTIGTTNLGSTVTDGGGIAQNYSTIAGGYDNVVGGAADYGFIGSGHDNWIGDHGGVVVGGRFNSADEECSFLGAGQWNQIRGDYSVLVGGFQNNLQAPINGSYGVIVGGLQNSSYADDAGRTVNDTLGGGAVRIFIGGGYQNTIRQNLGYNSQDAVIVGGQYNLVANMANGFCGGGDTNIVGQLDLDGGQQGSNSAVVGGYHNTVLGDTSFIGGGQNNTINIPGGSCGSIPGGSGNTVSASFATAIGGTSNVASGQNSTVAGNSNTASGANSTCLGNTNVCSGDSALGTGQLNNAAGDFSFAVGMYGSANREGYYAQSAGRFTVNGDAQRGSMVLAKTVSGGSVGELVTLHGGDALWLSNAVTVRVKEQAVATKNAVAEGSTKSASTEQVALIRRPSNADAVLLYSPGNIVFGEDPETTGWKLQVDVNNSRVRVRFDPAGDTSSIHVVGNVEITQVGKSDS